MTKRVYFSAKKVIWKKKRNSTNFRDFSNCNNLPRGFLGNRFIPSSSLCIIDFHVLRVISFLFSCNFCIIVSSFFFAPTFLILLSHSVLRYNGFLSECRPWCRRKKNKTHAIYVRYYNEEAFLFVPSPFYLRLRTWPYVFLLFIRGFLLNKLNVRV